MTAYDSVFSNDPPPPQPATAEDKQLATQQSGGTFPSVGSVPDKAPQTSSAAERRQVVKGLSRIRKRRATPIRHRLSRWPLRRRPARDHSTDNDERTCNEFIDSRRDPPPRCNRCSRHVLHRGYFRFLQSCKVVRSRSRRHNRGRPIRRSSCHRRRGNQVPSCRFRQHLSPSCLRRFPRLRR